MNKSELCGGCAVSTVWCITLVFEIVTYVLIIYDVIVSSMILIDNAGNWEHCTGGNFLHNITIFALITGVIGLVSGNTVNFIMFILYYAMGYNTIQQESGNCQIIDPNLYETVLGNQNIMFSLLLMSIPAALVTFIICGGFCYVCCEVCERCVDNKV
ncbi:hypothetical protein RclHR1_04800008 [Rhizophagus clarus]|uniref:Uncharacterized protein n=1 Tax=Rhizophagus clarus TaxID=94130 RepID=A0A2Z6RIV1_9GLOM|nr:hypothetical protein RclHR1_04800008 [Rhizophagus clarus]GES83222.1 hypothetical protein RCL_jg15933.t1 [Rhizophagus clarus]